MLQRLRGPGNELRVSHKIPKYELSVSQLKVLLEGTAGLRGVFEKVE